MTRKQHRWVPIEGLPIERLAGYDRARWNGDALREYRERHAMTIAEFAAATGFAVQTVYAWERGASCPEPGTIALAAHVFGTTLRPFFPPAS